MILNETTLKQLRIIINEASKYRSGYDLVSFFNTLGFNDVYGKGFPSRWMYTDEKLGLINGKPELDMCIKKIFAPNKYIGKYAFLDDLIEDFNQYLSYDDWLLVRRDKEISFKRTTKIYEKEVDIASNKTEFLMMDYGDISIDHLEIEPSIKIIIKMRLEELMILINNNASLTSVIMIGSILEGLLLAVASKFPKDFNTAKSSPMDKEGKPKKFYTWNLNDFITVAYELDIFKEDVHKFASSLRYFRNYIHPYQQLSSNFNPSKDTADICYQVLKASISQLTRSKYFINK